MAEVKVGTTTLSEEEAKKAYGSRFSQVDVTDTNPTYLATDESEEGDLTLVQKKNPIARQRKVKFAKR